VPNQLVNAVSPYLLQHAADPVHWQQWNRESLSEAQIRGVPIFLSIGYSTCHWCHVMAQESFADPAVADRLNASFVAIKVDREERPDLDRVYMSYVQAVSGRGGWPLSVWLTPDLKPFFGGTYFPLEDKGDQPGFGRVLDSITAGWDRDRAQVEAEGDRILTNLREAKATPPVGDALPDLTEPGGDAFERAYVYFFENHDPQSGGFGSAPKFPRPQVIAFLLRCAVLQGLDSESGQEAMSMVHRSLVGMSRGGIHDQIGGGFHRYAVDEEWRIPHFEKMLYDQAQIAGNLIEAYRFSGDERLAGIASHLFAYLERDLRHPQGGFFSAEDADSQISKEKPRKQEGAFYLWTYEELAAAVGDQLSWFGLLFGLRPEGNVPTSLDPKGAFKGRNVLHQMKSIREVASEVGLPADGLAERLEAILSSLRERREVRPRPHRDEKIVTAWNGLMIASLAEASVSEAVELRPKVDHYRKLATMAANFVRENLWDAKDKTLSRTWREGRRAGAGLAEDYAAMIHGLLALFDATFESEWLRWADELQTTMDQLFWDQTGGGYFQGQLTDQSIVLQLKDDYDGAEPSANSLAVTNQFRLAAILHDNVRRERALKTLQAFRHVWSKTPWALPAMLMGVEWALAAPKQVLIFGQPTEPEFQRMVTVARDRCGQRRVTVAVSDVRSEDWLQQRLPHLTRFVAGRVQAQVCTATNCSAIAYSASDLLEELNS
jgi:uncharacterized protein